MASHNEIHSPYKLQLTIHGAENLPIADWTTSDPFVTITIGGRLEGRTKTIYRNRSPLWNEIFNLKLLHRRSVVVLKIFDEDKGKDDDLLGSVVVDLSEFNLDQTGQKKYAVIGYGAYDTKASKIEISVLIHSNASVIKVVPELNGDALPPPPSDEDNSPRSPDSTSSDEQSLLAIIAKIKNTNNIVPSESTVNALTSFITRDKTTYFPPDLLRDLIQDSNSLVVSQSEAVAFARTSSKTIYNRTCLRLVNSSKIIMSTKTTHWHPPLPKNTLQINLCANDSHFVAIQFHNRLSMWVFTRWIIVLYEYWHGRVKSAALPCWCANNTYSSNCTVHLSDGSSVAGRLVLAPMRPYELRVGDERISIDPIHNIIVSADTLVPKTDILDIEVVSYSATGEDEEAAAHEAAAKKGMFQTVRMGIRGTVKGLATGAVSVVSGAADAAVSTTIGVASTTVGAARSLASGKPINIIHTAQDNLFAVGKDIRSILKDATAALGEASTYVSVKFDNVSEKVHRADHFYVDCNQESFGTRSMSSLRRSSFGLIQMPENPEDVAVAAYPDIDRSSSSVSMFLCHGNDTAQMVIGHKRVSAQWLKEKVGQNTEIRLDTQVGYSITLINSRGLQLTPPGKMKIGAGGMHVKMKFTDKHGNSKSLGRLQEVKTQSIPPTANPDWKDCTALFKAQDGFENAAFLRIEICLDDFTTNFIVGTCFIPLGLFRKKSKEITLPMTRFKLNAMHTQDPSVLHCLGETTMRIYRLEEGCSSMATVRFRASHLECNIFNTRWYAECVPAGTVNTEGLRDVEGFSMLPTQEGLELVSFGQLGAIRSADAGGDPSETPAASSKGNTAPAASAPERDMTPPSVDSLALTEDWTRPSGIADGADFGTIEVYENQRRQPYYPFDWSNRAYTRPLYSDVTLNVGYTFEKLDVAVPPPGCIWASEWCYDKKYTETDEDGWVYGLAFRQIVANSKNGKSHTKPQNMMARRRKWVRKIMSNDRSSLAGRNMMQLFEKSNTAKGQSLPHVASKQSMESASTHGAAEAPSPKIPAPTLDSKVVSWRNEFLAHYPSALVGACQERTSLQSSVLIPWDQVKDACVVTASVLSVYVQVNRYMQSTTGGTFRPAEVEIFVSNCPAAELKSMIDERKWFASFKGKIRNLVASGTITGLVDDADFGEDRVSETEDYIPDTEELSLGSELVADLDQHSILLEAEVRRLDQCIGQHNTSLDKAALREKAILLRRDCRLRVYMAALFGVGLKGNHNFINSEMQEIMDRDLKVSQNIKQETEVATANNRIEFFLDTAEKRIRDAVLCGWSHRGGQLERCVEMFANGYYIEIVGLLGAFFEDTGINQVKGLGSKVELINTYLKHNDRLATILDHALRPYALKAQPAATLSLFLDFDILVSWYTSVLLLEMRDRVNDVLRVWKDKSTDAAGAASEYKHAVPWVPQHGSREDTQYFTAIPEDLVEVLLTYLQYARIHKETVAPSFVASVGRLDAEVLMAYTSSFLYLSEQLAAALKSKDWAAATAEDELGEYATWLSSVANDARRVESERLHAPNRVADAAAKEGDSFAGGSQDEIKKEELIEKRTLKAFREVTLTALDHLSCIVFLYVFHERTHLLSDSLYKVWLDTLPPEGKPAADADAPAAIIPAIMEDVTFYLHDKQSFLAPACYWRLVSLATDKVYIIYLSVFKIAHCYGGAFGWREREQIRHDIASMRHALRSAMEASPHASAEYKDQLLAIDEKFVPLDLCCDLLEHDLASVAFDSTMKKLQSLAEKHPLDASALASLIETFLGLKGVSKYASRKRAAPRKSEGGATLQAAAAQAAANPTAGSQGQAHPTVAATPATAAKRRGSMFDYFMHGGHATQTPEPVASASVHGDPTPPHTVPVTSVAHGVEPPTPPTPAEADVDEDDEAEMRKAQQLREQALVDCIGLAIQVVRSHCKFNNSKHSMLCKSSPIERVFGTDHTSEFPLDVQILHSACPPANAAGAVSSSSYFGAFKGLFGSSRQKSQSTRSRNEAQPSSPMSPHSDDGAETLGQIALSGLKVEDLFYLDSLRSPHPYLKVQFGNFTFTTKVLVADTSADWSAEVPILVPLRGVGTSDSARNSLSELHISLHYKGFLTDQVIGTVVVEFAPYSPPLFVDRRFPITDFKSPQAILAAKRAQQETRSCPSIIVSVAPVNGASAAATAAALASAAEAAAQANE